MIIVAAPDKEKSIRARANMYRARYETTIDTMLRSNMLHSAIIEAITETEKNIVEMIPHMKFREIEYEAIQAFCRIIFAEHDYAMVFE